jgi:disulfide bond formation protein DsbB
MGISQQMQMGSVGRTDLDTLPAPERFRMGPRMTGRMTGVAIIAVASAMLGFALVSQFVYGLQPCELCLLQRWPWVGAALFGLAAAIFVRNKFAQAVLLLVAGLILVANSGVAGFHVGVEQGWWKGPVSCSGGGLPSGASVEELRAYLLAAPTVSCSDIVWSLFGLSMAGYNMLISLGAGLLVIAKAWHVQTEPVDAE